MDTKVILEDLLDTSQKATTKGLQIAEKTIGVPEEGAQRDAMIDGLGKGVLAASAVALLLGTNSGRRLSRKAFKAGSPFALGGLAYAAYDHWQQKQNVEVPNTGTPINDLAETEAQTRSEAIVQAMISAAKSDGHLDTEEQNIIATKMQSLGLENDVMSFLMKELNKPADVASVIALSDSPATARELYLASAMVVDLNNADEREYMDSLAGGLELDAELVKELEATLS